MKFSLNSVFQPTGDQPQAITNLCTGINKNLQEQVLLGVTGSGKTFTLANVVFQTQLPVLVISHNKTLAAQTYQEFKSFFPGNAVSYFVSYYDYYQPEAYIPQTDTYIEKETEINEEIDKLRLEATTNILTRQDTIVVASVSCIYNIGSPREYGSFILELRPGVQIRREDIFKRFIELQYLRSDFGFHRGTFRVRGESIDIFPAYEDFGYKIEISGNKISQINKIDPLTGQLFENLKYFILYPAKHYMTDTRKNQEVFGQIEKDLETQIKAFKEKGKLLEAHRLQQKVKYDLEMIAEIGYVNGIENYSRYFDGRKPGEPPFTLFDYFRDAYKDNWLLFIDESHITAPQLRGMYNGDRTRKETLVNFGFRLPASLDNRPLKFEELLRRIPRTIYVSATPDEWELNRAKVSARRAAGSSKSKLKGIVEQLVRPTGLMDPVISVRPTEDQINDLISEIGKRIVRKERILVTTLTKRMAEDLADFLTERNIKVHYLHSDIVTLERTDILDNLRRGQYDVIVGINLLREGLDLPEVSLVAILDADKEGFLRSQTSLIQTMGRAARHIQGSVIMYADKVTGSMERAISEVSRRRRIQLAYNTKYGITPATISKPYRDKLVDIEEINDPVMGKKGRPKTIFDKLVISLDNLTPFDKKRLIKNLEKEMRLEAENLNFELAAEIRDRILKIKSSLEK